MNNTNWEIFVIFITEKCNQGLLNSNKVKQYEIVLSFKVSLFIQFAQLWKQRVFVNIVG